MARDQQGGRSAATQARWASSLPGSPVGSVGLAIAGFTTWLALSIGGTAVTRAVDDTATVIAAGVATFCCLSAAVRGAGHRRDRAFWLLLGAACAAWTFGEGAWGVYDLWLGSNVPVPSVADLGYLAAVPLAIAALLCHPSQRRGTVRRTRAALDGTILATALLFLTWTYALGPVWRNSDLTTVAGLVAIGYPFGDVVVLFLLVRVLLNLGASQRRSIGWVLVGLFALAVSDSGYTYLTVARGYTTGNLIDVGWLVAYLALALGGWSARRIEEPARRELIAPNPTFAVLGPYLPLLVALGSVATRVQGPDPIDGTSLLLAFALTGLVLIRQTLTAASPDRVPRAEPQLGVRRAGEKR